MATDQRTGSRGARGGETDGLPAAVIEQLVADPRRRALLGLLIDRGEAVPVDDLAAHLAESAEPSRAERREARTEIYQEHLPKLTAPDVVAFDSLLGTVTYRGGDALAARLAALETDPKDK
jgi:hypothetical protein